MSKKLNKYQLIRLLGLLSIALTTTSCDSEEDKTKILTALITVSSETCDSGVLSLFDDSTCSFKVYFSHHYDEQMGTYQIDNGTITLIKDESEDLGCDLFASTYQLNMPDSILIPMDELHNSLTITEIDKNNKLFKIKESKILDDVMIQKDTSEQFMWHITRGEIEEPYYAYYSEIKFTYAGKTYKMDTLFSRVHGCEDMQPDHPSGACDFENTNLLGAYFGADGGVFCEGQIIDKGDSLIYWQSCSVEEDGGTTPIEFTTTFLK